MPTQTTSAQYLTMMQQRATADASHLASKRDAERVARGTGKWAEAQRSVDFAEFQLNQTLWLIEQERANQVARSC
jgi:hypothetical protein